MRKLLKLIILLGGGYFAFSAHAQEKYIAMVGINVIPFTYSDGKGGQEGFEIDLLTEIGKVENIQFEFQPMVWEVLLQSLVDDKADVVASGLAITEQRLKTVDFTDSYSYIPKKLLISKDVPNIEHLEELKDKKITVLHNSSTANMLERMGGFENLINENVVFQQFKKVYSGEADATLTTGVVVDYYQKRYGNEFGTYVVPLEEGEQYAFAIKKGNQELANKINSGLRKIKENGTYDAVYQKYFAE